MKKKKLEEKLVNGIRRVVVDCGNLFLFLYIGFSSVIIAQQALYIFYMRHESLFLDHLNESPGGGLITTFFQVGIIIACIWFSLGLFAMLTYKNQLRLKRMGYKSKKSIMEKAVFPDKKIKEGGK